jgi:hypothetical protein
MAQLSVQRIAILGTEYLVEVVPCAVLAGDVVTIYNSDVLVARAGWMPRCRQSKAAAALPKAMSWNALVCR